MICIIALIVFGILSIFSASYRPIAKEAFDCVFRRLTLRKCESGLDVRLKGQITGKIMKRSPKIGKFLYKRFEIISWLFLILMIWSTVQSGISTYNYFTYGNCNGKQNGEGFCLFDPAGKSKFSTTITNYTGPIILPNFGNSPSIGPNDAKIEIIEFGCYLCPYTKKAEPIVKQILQAYTGKVKYTFRDFPVSSNHENAEFHAMAAKCANDQGKYWQFRDYMFSRLETMNHTKEGVKQVASEFGLDMNLFNSCYDSNKYFSDVEKDVEAGIKAGVYGTPTFFINNRTIVGPQDFDTFKKVIEGDEKTISEINNSNSLQSCH